MSITTDGMRKKWLFTLLGLGVVLLSAAQDPVQFSFSAKKVSEGVFELHLKATVAPSWNIYSGGTPEGGPLPTKVSFNTNPLVALTGSVTEAGARKTKHEPLFGVDVIYFQKSVDFVQTVKVKNTKIKTSVIGQVEYMACNDQQCLPPKTIPFTITLN